MKFWRMCGWFTSRFGESLELSMGYVRSCSSPPEMHGEVLQWMTHHKRAANAEMRDISELWLENHQWLVLDERCKSMVRVSTDFGITEVPRNCSSISIRRLLMLSLQSVYCKSQRKIFLEFTGAVSSVAVHEKFRSHTQKFTSTADFFFSVLEDAFTTNVFVKPS